MHPASARLPRFVEKRLSPACAPCSRSGTAARTRGTRNAFDLTHLEQCSGFRGLHSGKPIMLIPACALVMAEMSSTPPGTSVNLGSTSGALCGVPFRFVEPPPCLDRRSLLRFAAFRAERIGPQPVGPETAGDGGAPANLRSAMGTIQTFCPDDLQQRHLQMTDFCKKASRHFTWFHACRLATRRSDDAQRAVGLAIGTALVRCVG